jgi:hypothetical protein
VRKRVSVVALLTAGLLGAAAQAGEDPATRLGALDATADQRPGGQRVRPRPPIGRLPTASGGELGLAPSAQPMAAGRPSEQTTFEWLQRFGAVDTRPVEPTEKGQDPL